MTPPTPGSLARAQQGDPTAIAALINHSLQPKGITAAVQWVEGCLQVMLEAAHIPDQKALVEFVRKGIINLEIASLQTLQVSARQPGALSPAWSQTIAIAPLPPTDSPDAAPQDMVDTATPVEPLDAVTPGEPVDLVQPPSAPAANDFADDLSASLTYVPPRSVSRPAHPGHPHAHEPGHSPPPRRPNSFLIPSILVALFAFLPLGVVAIIFAAQVETKYNQGDYAGAKSAANTAKVLCLVGGGIGALFYLLTFALIGAVLVPAFQNQGTRARESEAKQYLGAINRAEQAFYLEENRFTTDLDELGIGISDETSNYRYRIITAEGGLAWATATAKTRGLKSSSAIVYLTRTTGGEETTITEICIGDRPSQTPPAMPQLSGDRILCPSGSTSTIPSSRSTLRDW